MCCHRSCLRRQSGDLLIICFCTQQPCSDSILTVLLVAGVDGFVPGAADRPAAGFVRGATLLDLGDLLVVWPATGTWCRSRSEDDAARHAMLMANVGLLSPLLFVPRTRKNPPGHVSPPGCTGISIVGFPQTVSQVFSRCHFSILVMKVGRCSLTYSMEGSFLHCCCRSSLPLA